MRSVSHPLALALFSNASMAAEAAAALHALGIRRDQISVVAHSRVDARALADLMDATPGVDLEDSRPAARLGELGGQVLAAIALVMPGIGPIVAAGPLAAELGEAVGHAAGGLASVLASAGVPQARADALQREVERGSVLVAIHVTSGHTPAIVEALTATGAVNVDTANWEADE